jgi:hypothetical protein
VSNHELNFIATGLCFDKADGSIYVGATTNFNNYSAVFKIPTVLPFSNVTLPLKTAILNAKLTTNVACVPNGVVFVGSFDFNTGKKITVFSNDLRRSAAVAFSTNNITTAAEANIENMSPFMYITPSNALPGTLLFGGNDPKVHPQVRRVGFKSTVVRLVHRKTQLHLTMMRDGEVALFHPENTTMNQVWEIHPFSHAIRNLGTKWALTVKGHPKVIPNYDQQNGFIVTGQPYAHKTTQRWWYDPENHNIFNMLDGKCVGLDREFLRENRFPGQMTGLRLVTTYCHGDLLLKFLTIKPDIF